MRISDPSPWVCTKNTFSVYDLDSSDEPILPSILTVPFDNVEAFNVYAIDPVFPALLNIVLSSALGV
jgi:hypothetical protein